MLSILLSVLTNLVCLSSDWVRCVAFKPNNANIVVSGSDDKTIIVWDITSGSCLSTLSVDYKVSSVAYSPDGSKLAATNGLSVSIFNVETGEVQCTVKVDGAVYSVAFLPRI